MREIVIGNRLAEVTVRPFGAAITSYRTDRADLCWDWLVNDGDAHPGCFPMLPFCSRIGHGRFTFDGRTITLPANNPPEAHAIHGHGFQRLWEVDDVSGDSIVLSYLHLPDSWPWCYQARQIIRLCDTDLTLELQVRNLSDSAMPVGLGLHPYFPRTAQMCVTAQVHGLWHLDADLLGRDVQPIPEHLHPGRGLSVQGAELDHVFTAWAGTAHLEWPERQAKLTMTASVGYSNLVVYAPAGADFVCVEPASNAPDGFNMALQNLPDAYQVITPGCVARRTWSLRPRRAMV